MIVIVIVVLREVSTSNVVVVVVVVLLSGCCGAGCRCDEGGRYNEGYCYVWLSECCRMV